MITSQFYLLIFIGSVAYAKYIPMTILFTSNPIDLKSDPNVLFRSEKDRQIIQADTPLPAKAPSISIDENVPIKTTKKTDTEKGVNLAVNKGGKELTNDSEKNIKSDNEHSKVSEKPSLGKSTHIFSLNGEKNLDKGVSEVSLEEKDKGAVKVVDKDSKDKNEKKIINDSSKVDENLVDKDKGRSKENLDLQANKNGADVTDKTANENDNDDKKSSVDSNKVAKSTTPSKLIDQGPLGVVRTSQKLKKYRKKSSTTTTTTLKPVAEDENSYEDEDEVEVDGARIVPPKNLPVKSNIDMPKSVALDKSTTLVIKETKMTTPSSNEKSNDNNYDTGAESYKKPIGGKQNDMREYETKLTDDRQPININKVKTIVTKGKAMTKKEDSSNFMMYLTIAIVFIAFFYVVYHNRAKVMAFIVEGRNSRTAGSRRYRRVSANPEEDLKEVLATNGKGEVNKSFIY